MKKVISLPRLSEQMKDGLVASFRKAPGESFRRGEVLFEVETDKVVCEIEATEDGTVSRALAEEGDTVKVGDGVVEIETKEA